MLKNNFSHKNPTILDSGDETDPEMNEWENQQIRKGVTGAQVIMSYIRLTKFYQQSIVIK